MPKYNVILISGQRNVASFVVEAMNRVHAKHVLPELPEYVEFSKSCKDDITDVAVTLHTPGSVRR